MGYWEMLYSTGGANLPLTDAWIGEAVWDSPRGIQKYPYKKGTPGSVSV
jgi:hypothetical protein